MSLILCAQRERQAMRLSHQEFRRLEYAWNEVYQREIAAGTNAAIAQRNANVRFDSVLQMLADERERAATMQLEAQERLMAEALGARNTKNTVDIGEWAVRLVNQMFFDARSMLKMDMAELSQFASEFRRTIISGRRLNPARSDNVVYELFDPGSTGDNAAQLMAQAWGMLNRRKVEQFNGAGGNIAFRADNVLPQRHDSASIRQADMATWIDAIVSHVDHTRMFNHDTGVAFRDEAELRAVLPRVYEDIVSFGDDALNGASFAGNSSNWRGRNDARFFVFKSGQDWLDYHATYGGGGNLIEVMHDWLRSMNHDIVAMSRLGPNPAATIQWLAGDKDIPNGLIGAHAREASFGRFSLFSPVDGRGNPWPAGGRGTAARMKYAKDRAFQALNTYDAFVGSARRPHDTDVAMAVASVDNLMYAHHLAYTPFLIGGDIVNQAMTRAFNGVQITAMFRDLFDAFRLSRDPETLNDIGVETDVALHTMLSEARDMAPIHGAAWTRVVADRTMTFSGLKPLTMGLRAMWSMGVMNDLRRLSGRAFADLPQNFRAMLQRYRIDEPAWDAIRATPAYRARGLNIIRPQDMAQWGGNFVVARPGLTEGQELAVRVQAMIESEGEFATVSGTPRSQAVLPYRPGTITGTAIGSMARLKTYAISHAQHHGARAAEIFWRNGGGLRGSANAFGYYALGLIIPGMLFTAMGTVAADMAAGKEPPDVTDWRFWDRVFWRTISLGFFQDVFSGVYESDSPQEAAARIAGPTIQALYQPLATAGSALGEIGPALGFGEDKNQTGRQTLRTAENFVPRTWWTDLAMKRLVWDNAQRFADPEAEADFRRRAQRAGRDGGTGFYWAPGQDWPQRGPDLSNLDLGDDDSDLRMD